MITLRHGIIDQKIASVAATYPTDGLLARYALDNNLEDSYGPYSDLVSVSTPAEWEYGTGKVNQDFKTNYVSGLYNGKKVIQNTTDASVYKLCHGTGKNWGISFWAKVTDSALSLGYGLVFQNTVDGHSNPKFGWYNPGTPQFIGFGDDGVGYWFFVNEDYRDSQWHHYAIYANDSSTVCYIDNTYKTAAARKNITLTINATGIGGIIGIGQQLPGEIDQIYLYNRALTVNDIAQLYNDGNGV